MKLRFLLLAILLVGLAGGQWLDEGSPDYGELRRHFTDPIFYPRTTPQQDAAVHAQYYPYFGEQFFRDSIYPSSSGLRQPIQLGQNWSGMVPDNAFSSEFRNASLAAMDWPSFQKNWTKTMEYVRSSSTLRIYKDGQWITV